jgi:hypothetical protein
MSRMIRVAATVGASNCDAVEQIGEVVADAGEKSDR